MMPVSYPIIKSEFVENQLNGAIFNPIFFHRYVDWWLGYFINKHCGIDCPFRQSFNIKASKNYNCPCVTTEEESLYDNLINNILQKLNAINYLENNIKLEDFIEQKVEKSTDLTKLYKKYYYRLNLPIKYLNKHIKNKQRPLDISFLIATRRKKNEAKIPIIIQAIKHYGTKYNYDIIVFSNYDDYRGKYVKNIEGPDYGSAWAYNRCYELSEGKNIVALTDYTIPLWSVFDFIDSSVEIASMS